MLFAVIVVCCYRGNIKLRLRPLKPCDLSSIAEWTGMDEKAFYMWSAGKFEFPVDEQQLKEFYKRSSNDEGAWSVIALDDSGAPVGHVLMRKADYENNSIHFGFIIINPGLRGKGCGREMISLALKYAFEIMGFERATLGVFDVNPAAHKCYMSAGFRDERYLENAFEFQGEKWGLYEMAAENKINA